MSDAAITAISGAIGGFAAALAGALPFYYAYRIKMKELQNQLAWESSQKNAYKSMTKDAIGYLETNVNERLINANKPPLAVVVDVVAEYQSPVKKEDQDVADLQSARKRLVAVQLALGVPAREIGVPETDPQRAARLAAESKGTVVDAAAVLGSKLTHVVVADLKQDIAEVKEVVDTVPKDVVDEIKKREEK